MIAGLLYLALMVILVQVGGLPTNGAALLWDLATALLMVRFYYCHLSNSMDIVEVLHEAQR